MTTLIWEELTAVGTLLLAIATFVAVFREPFSNWRRSPNVIVEPSNATYDAGNPNYYFATLKAEGNNPLHVWVRIGIRNTGRAMAENVYVRMTSVKRYNPKNGNSTNSIKPFNPFRLRWVSESTDAGDLINDEPAYLNLCTLVGKYKDVQASNSKYFIPVIVPGIPNKVNEEVILGEGQVAGMDPSIYKVGLNASYRYELIVGGSNINSKRYYLDIIYSLNRRIKEDIGQPDPFNDLRKFLKLQFKVNEE